MEAYHQEILRLQEALRQAQASLIPVRTRVPHRVQLSHVTYGTCDVITRLVGVVVLRLCCAVSGTPTIKWRTSGS